MWEEYRVAVRRFLPPLLVGPALLGAPRLVAGSTGVHVDRDTARVVAIAGDQPDYRSGRQGDGSSAQLQHAPKPVGPAIRKWVSPTRQNAPLKRSIPHAMRGAS